jgi:hypothetical protein
MKRAQFVLCCTLLCPWLLSGCSTTARAGLDTIAQALRGANPDVERLELNPQLTYLRVQIGRQVGLMVRADEPSIAPAELSDRSRWYSADGVVLRFAQGRIVAMHDRERSWAWVDSPQPVDWRRAAAGEVQRWREVSDQQPGYRLGRLRERELQVVRAVPPGDVLEASRHLTAPVTWFEERNVSGDPQTTWYAVDLSAPTARVVYGQTCLQEDWCLNWQVWPPQAPRLASRTVVVP